MSTRMLYKTLRHFLHPLRREWRARMVGSVKRVRARWQLLDQERRGELLIADVDGIRLRLVPRGAVAEEVTLAGAFEPHEVRLILGLLGPGKTFFDVGANAGFFSLAAALRWPEAQVFAFEPCMTTFELLETNIRLNNVPNVRAVRTALADYIGDAPLKINAHGRDGLNTLVAPLHPSCRVVGEEIVPMTTLDAFLASENVAAVDVMKVDVEGAERLVFGGAQELLSSPNAPILLYEDFGQTPWGAGYSPMEEVADMLQGFGYRLLVLDSANGCLAPMGMVPGAMILAIKPQHTFSSPLLSESLRAL